MGLEKELRPKPAKETAALGLSTVNALVGMPVLLIIRKIRSLRGEAGLKPHERIEGKVKVRAEVDPVLVAKAPGIRGARAHALHLPRPGFLTFVSPLGVSLRVEKQMLKCAYGTLSINVGMETIVIFGIPLPVISSSRAGV